MNDTVSLKDRKGRAILTLRVRGGCEENPKLIAVAGRIRRMNAEHANPVKHTVEGAFNIVSREVNRGLRGAPATQDELLAALESRITIDGLIHKIHEMRDPLGYYSEPDAAA